MKKLFVALVACMFAAPSFAQFSSGGFSLDEEHMYWGVRLGLNFAGIGGDIEADKGRTGMTLGGVVGLRVSDSAPVFLESGLYYTERGGKNLKYNNLPLADKGHLNYIEVPALIKYGISTENNIAILPFIGPTFAMGISGSYKYLKHPEMGIKIGCGVEWNNLYAEMAYQIGVTNIADGDKISGAKDLSSHGHALAINIGVNF
ncbi:MAG: outer membrane beta-barrel protein [Prevotella sp.]|nr:outer membrane beta-barrel protein [Prevotella sp.]